MTVDEAIDRVDRLKCNAYTLREEAAWEGSRELTAPDSFGGLYLRWLEAQIDLYNGEPERYNGSIALFNAEFHAFESWYNRTFLPKNGGDWRG